MLVKYTPESIALLFPDSVIFDKLNWNNKHTPIWDCARRNQCPEG